MTKAANQTASGKVHPNHSKSKEDKQAKEMARKAKRKLAVDAKAKALQEAKDNGMSWDDTVPAQSFVDDYNKAYVAATKNGPALPETEVKGDAGFAEAVLPKKGMIAEAVDKAKAEAEAVVEKPTKSAQESAELFAAADKTTGKADGLKVFATFVANVLEAVTKAQMEAENATTTDPVEVAPTAEPREDVSGSETGEVAPVDESGKAAPTLSKNQLRKIARREAKRALQEAKRTNVETTDVTPSIEATATATEGTTAANENEPENKGNEVPVSESQPETVASSESAEQPVSADGNRDLAPGTKLPWHKRTAYDTMKAGVLALPPPEPKRPTQEEINAASTETGPQELRNEDDSQTESVPITADSTVDTATTGECQVVAERSAVVEDDQQLRSVEEPTEATVVEATVGTVAKPELILPCAKPFYGAAYDKAVDTKLLDAALFWLDKAIEKEAINGDIAKRHMELAWKTALKKEAEAFSAAMKKAA